MSCGAGLANRILQKIELELLAAKKRRLENEAKCWRLTKECLEAIKRLEEKVKEMNLPETALEAKLNHHGRPWMQNPPLASGAAGKGVSRHG